MMCAIMMLQALMCSSLQQKAVRRVLCLLLGYSKFCVWRLSFGAMLHGQDHDSCS